MVEIQPFIFDFDGLRDTLEDEARAIVTVVHDNCSFDMLIRQNQTT